MEKVTIKMKYAKNLQHVLLSWYEINYLNEAIMNKMPSYTLEKMSDIIRYISKGDEVGWKKRVIIRKIENLYLIS